MVLRELMNPAFPGVSMALDAVARFGLGFLSCRSQSEIIASFCEAMTAAGYSRAAVGHWVDGDPRHILLLIESPARDGRGVVDLSRRKTATSLALGGENPYVVETTIARTDGADATTESVIAVTFPWRTESWGVLLVESNEPDAFADPERAAVEYAASHLSVGLEIVGQREAIQSGEDRYRQLLENVDEIVYTATGDGRITYVSPAIERVLGVPSSAVLGDGFEQFVALEDRAAIWEGFTRQRTGGPPVELRVRDAGGRLRVLRASLFPTQTGAGDLIGAARDVTEQLLAAERLLKTFEGTVRALDGVTVARDPYTAIHQERVSRLASAVAEEMAFDPDRVRGIRYAGLIHDIGKVSVPAEILNKPAKLTEPERALLEAHPAVGYGILSASEFPWPIAEIVIQHHERLDGSGYPHHLRGSEILLDARILSIADVVEAMVSHRPYRPARCPRAARDEITLHAGELYDPDVVAACLRVLSRVDSPLAETPSPADGRP
ncbi:MAG: HD domain-containing phosphohydrolase [Thermotogota bacterium]